MIPEARKCQREEIRRNLITFLDVMSTTFTSYFCV